MILLYIYCSYVTLHNITLLFCTYSFTVLCSYYFVRFCYVYFFTLYQVILLYVTEAFGLICSALVDLWRCNLYNLFTFFSETFKRFWAETWTERSIVRVFVTWPSRCSVCAAPSCGQQLNSLLFSFVLISDDEDLLQQEGELSHR